MLKKIFSSILVVAMLATLCTTVFANDSISPYAASCTKCYEGQMATTTHYGSWARTGSARNCSQMPYGQDLEEERLITSETKCNRCSTSGGTSSRTETRWICYGHY